MPMVGWPANGTSAWWVKMSIFLSVGAVPSSGRCRKTISERLNSEAIDCFCAFVRLGEMEAGTWTMATGFPV